MLSAATSGAGEETENIFPGSSSLRKVSFASGAKKLTKGDKDKPPKAGIEKD